MAQLADNRAARGVTGEMGVSFHHALHALAHARERPSAHKHQRKRSVRGDELRFVLRPTFSPPPQGDRGRTDAARERTENLCVSGEEAQGTGRFVQVSDFFFSFLFLAYLFFFRHLAAPVFSNLVW